MDRDRSTLVEELFFRAADLPPHERERFLDGSGLDDDLLTEVRSLLAHDRAAGSMFSAVVPLNASMLLPWFGGALGPDV